MRLAIYDSRKSSKTFGEINEWELSLDNPKLIKIPKLLYHGFKCISKKEAIVINIPTVPYNSKKPDEYRLDAFDSAIPYDWNK